ncbi:hypothetical protein Zmor_015260 [Zophobas morio]|uniref:Uncharacterized protein n=1 Tax=Zophobas morio TaxID=2755281 RepID=A0AA38IIY5_9CUCU|nr:hypothetical protein Zmor_015260 [Zophobas morio]
MISRLERCIAHLVIGKLSSEEAGRPFLLALKQLDKTNSNTISRFINELLALLWPKGTELKQFKWFVSDGASYMIKTGTNLKVFYENITHLTSVQLVAGNKPDLLCKNIPCRFILSSRFRGRSPPEIRVSGLRVIPALPPPERELAPERPPLLTEGATPRRRKGRRISLGRPDVFLKSATLAGPRLGTPFGRSMKDKEIQMSVMKNIII